MARARLLFRGRDGPDVVGQAGGNPLEHGEAGGVDAVVVGEEDAHRGAMQPPRRVHKLRLSCNNGPSFDLPYVSQFLLSEVGLTIGPVGDTDFSGHRTGLVLSSPPAEPVARCGSGGRMCVGEGVMATALIDLYGPGSTRFDQLILDEDYRPSDSEEFMCDAHRAYFLRKLKDWKEAIVVESRATMAQLQVDSMREPDIADRASSETDWSIELRTRDRQRKLIAKIDAAMRRLYEGEYGYCEVTGEPISLARLEARPVATMSLEAQEKHERVERVSRDD